MTRLEDADQFADASVPAILDKTRQVCEREIARSTIFDARALADDIPRFHSREIVLGRVVGRGGFCVIREITSVKLNGSSTSGSSSGRRSKKAAIRSFSQARANSNASSTRSSSSGRGGGGGGVATTSPPADMSSREYLARRVWSKGGKYVIKEVEPSLLQTDKVTYLRGLIDLVLEASFLSSLSHPNLLTLRGMSMKDPFTDIGYFLVLDQLQDTLPKRLSSWMQIKRSASGITGFMTGGKRKTASLLIDRLLVAYDVAEAMSYLHSNNVVYRDLKPDNIGFDGEGTLKVFDFGLAKELREDELCDDGLYLMTGFTGGIRYMSPEVGLYEPYNQLTDVYSWGMLLWCMMALEPPMGLYTPSMFIDRVFQKGYRPALKDKWPEALRDLMKRCWSREISDRPTFKCILSELREEATSIDPELGDFFAGDAASRTSSATSLRQHR